MTKLFGMNDFCSLSLWPCSKRVQPLLLRELQSPYAHPRRYRPNVARHARNFDIDQEQQLARYQWCWPITPLKLLQARMNIAEPMASEMLSVALLETQANRGSAMDYNVVLTVLPICLCSLPMLQGDPCTGNWLSAIRHTKARTKNDC